MSMYAIVGGNSDAMEQVASNRGWGDFVRWVDTLDASRYPRLVHLVEWGWVNEIDGLKIEIETALNVKPPKATVISTAKGIANLLEGSSAETILITNGTSPTKSNEGWEVGPLEMS